MKKFLIRLRNKQGSLLVSSVVLSSVMVVCLMMIVSTHAYHIKFLQLEKSNRLGKILIHKVWKTIEKDRIDIAVNLDSEKVREVYSGTFRNQTIFFNVGSVHVNSVADKIYLTAQLNNHVMVTQIYFNPYYQQE